jgi:iron complex outermembrane receptor protein
MKIGYKFSNWDVYLYGTNLTDEEYIDMYESNSLFSMATYGDPRFFGIGVRYTF